MRDKENRNKKNRNKKNRNKKNRMLSIKINFKIEYTKETNEGIRE